MADESKHWADGRRLVTPTQKTLVKTLNIKCKTNSFWRPTWHTEDEGTTFPTFPTVRGASECTMWFKTEITSWQNRAFFKIKNGLSYLHSSHWQFKISMTHMWDRGDYQKPRWESATTRQHGAWSEQTYLLKSKLKDTGIKKIIDIMMHSRDGAGVRLFLIHLENKNGVPLHIYNLTEPGRVSVHVTFLPVVHLKRSAGLPSFPTSSGTSADRRASQMSRP